MTMHIKVQYDARTRTFKLVDEEFKTLLEGDAFYDLVVPFMFDELDASETLSTNSLSVAHA